MSKEYDNTKRGALFANRRKETDNHPDFTGTINFDGKDYWLSGWKKISRGGDMYLSLSVGQEKTGNPKETEKNDKGELNADDIPF